MKSQIEKNIRTKRRTIRTRSKFSGTPQRPRLSVHRSLKHLSVQVIDDTISKTLASAHDREIKSKGTKMEKAAALGKLIAEKALAKKISQVVFDRGAFQYHGRIKALAEAARAGGLKF